MVRVVISVFLTVSLCLATDETVVWSGKIAGNVTVPPSTHIIVSSVCEVASGTVIQNYGSITVTNGGGFAPQYGGGATLAINNMPGGVFEIAQDENVFWYLRPPMLFTNCAGATLCKTAGTGGNALENLRLDNRGTIAVTSGELTFVPPGWLREGTEFRGSGRIVFGLPGYYADFFFDREILINGPTVVNAAGAAAFVALNEIVRVRTEGAGLFEWRNGGLQGSFEFPSGSHVVVSGGGGLFDSSRVENHGVWDWVSGFVGIDGDSVLVNKGTFNVMTNTGLMRSPFYSQQPAFTNDGVINLLRAGSRFNCIAQSPGGFQTTFTPNSVINVNMESETPNQFPQLDASRALLDLGGRLSVTVAPETSLTNGTSFVLAQYALSTNEFISVDLPPLAFPLTWRIDYGARFQSRVTLKIEQQIWRLTAPQRDVFGTLSFGCTGPAAGYCIFQTSSNLTEWRPISTNSPFTGSALFQEEMTEAGRFYRAMLFP
ncbi:MAG TPA: hypothetical protein VK530_05620 [Candidatus Acidoferrum sp.]|nr:hypothetical protein [Candidatus Acidoferrum sp.]